MDVNFLASHVCHPSRVNWLASCRRLSRRHGALISSMARALSSLLHIESKHEADVCLGCFG
jgi:hypothetical protein